MNRNVNGNRRQLMAHTQFSKHTLVAASLLLLAQTVGLPTQVSAAPAANADFLLVPGKSLGQIALGMTVSQVKELLGPPTKEQAGAWLQYKNQDDLVVFIEHDKVAEIRFTSKRYQTENGLTLGNYEQKRWHGLFQFARLQTKFMNTRCNLKSGGLAIYRVNLDGTAQYPVQTIGLIYDGQPNHQARLYAGEPDGGWEEWDGTGATLWERMQHQNPGGLNPFGL